METKRKDLDQLRVEIKEITLNIMRLAQQRMELSKQIGEIKGQLKIDIKDERVEQEVRKNVILLSQEIGMDEEFSGRLLNMLLVESVRLQQNQNQTTNNNNNVANPVQTHLGIFMKAKQLEMTGKKIIHLEVGEPDYPPPANIRDSLINAFDNKNYHYTETKGIPKLRRAIAEKAGNDTDMDQVIVTPGGRFAVFSAIAALVQPGDEIIAIEPAWPAYKECADFLGAKTKILETSFEEKWNPDIEWLKELINTNTKMIVINYPNNPTGIIPERENIDAIVDCARDKGLFLLSDEVYSDYRFKEFKSIMQYDYDKSITICSFSKSYAMTGFRVGYAISSKNIISRMSKIQATAITSVAEPIQYCALTAINEDPSKNVKIMEKRLQIISDKIREMGLPFVNPDGAMYVFPKISSGYDDIGFVEKMLDKGVAIAPGSGFGNSYKQFIRISACRSEEQLLEGLETIRRYLHK